MKGIQRRGGRLSIRVRSTRFEYGVSRAYHHYITRGSGLERKKKTSRKSRLRGQNRKRYPYPEKLFGGNTHQ